jgi:hypothetical protein
MSTVILLAHGLVGWALCGAIIAAARKRTTLSRALLIHAVGAPIVFALLSVLYFSVFHYTSPLTTAGVFVGVIVLMDAGVVAPFMENSFDMFRSVLGTWVPFGLIFAAVYLTGVSLVGWLSCRIVTGTRPSSRCERTAREWSG